MKKKLDLNWWNININKPEIRSNLMDSFDKRFFSQGKISARVENEICKKIKNSKKIIRVNYQSLHKTNYFKKFLNKNEKFLNSNNYNKYSFYLPSGPDQDIKKIKILLNNLKKILK